MRKLLLIGLVLLLAGAAVALGIRQMRRAAQAKATAEIAAFERALTATLDEALARQESTMTALSRRFDEIDNLKTAQELQLRRYLGHLQTARTLGVGRVSSRQELERLVAANRLVPLRDTSYFFVQELDYSMPYVTPDAAAFLYRMGERFQAALQAEGLPPYRYCISSVLRTGENQQALRRINPNAALGVSTHEFGTTVDVVYHRYDYARQPGEAPAPTPYGFLNARLETMRLRSLDALGMVYWQELQGILGRVLIEMQEEGTVLVTLERNQPVFHLTVAEPLSAR